MSDDHTDQPILSPILGQQEEEEEEDVMRLSALPTLRAAYAHRTSPFPTPRFPPFPRALDTVSLWRGDITTIDADAIVNAANRSLLGGGGVDGAIHRAAGPDLRAECETLGGASTGEAKITRGYALPAKHIIHAVGPVYSSSRAEACAQLLRACYANSYALAVQHNLTSIGFCSISTGIYGYPIVPATRIALDATRDFLLSPSSANITRVVFVVFSEKDKDVYEHLLPEYFPPEEEASAAEHTVEGGQSMKEKDEGKKEAIGQSKS